MTDSTPSDPAPDVLEVRDLDQARGGRQILHGVSFSVPKGSIYTLIGPSGSGKSTLLRLFNRLDEPPPGSLFFHGRDITSWDVLALRRQIGMVFQTAALFPGTVADNLRYGPALVDRRATDEEICAMLAAVDLDPGLAGREASRLSGGQAQRVSLARTLFNRPEILLLDEPTSALDPAATLKIEQLIIRLRNELDLTVVWVTHDMAQARRVGDCTLLLIDGHLADIGETGHLMEPGSHHRLVQDFVAGRLAGRMLSGPDGGKERV